MERVRGVARLHANSGGHPHHPVVHPGHVCSAPLLRLATQSRCNYNTGTHLARCISCVRSAVRGNYVDLFKFCRDILAAGWLGSVTGENCVRSFTCSAACVGCTPGESSRSSRFVGASLLALSLTKSSNFLQSFALLFTEGESKAMCVISSDTKERTPRIPLKERRHTSTTLKTVCVGVSKSVMHNCLSAMCVSGFILEASSSHSVVKLIINFSLTHILDQMLLRCRSRLVRSTTSRSSTKEWRTRSSNCSASWICRYVLYIRCCCMCPILFWNRCGL